MTQSDLRGEWMFGDCHATARFNPVRWSGSLSLEDVIKQLDRLESKEKSRPVVLKIPPGVFTPEEVYKNTADAIARLQKALNRTPSFLKNRKSLGSNPSSPVCPLGGQGQAAHLNAESDEPSVEWRFGDIPSLGGFNPLRWSGVLTFDKAIGDLEGLSERHRPVVLKIPAGIFTPEQHFGNAAEAVAHIRWTRAKVRRAAISWAVELTSFLCAIGEESVFEGKVPLLPVEEFSSVQVAVDQLNINPELCPGGLCVVHSKFLEKYVLVFRADKQEEARQLFGFGKLSWRDFAKRQGGEDGYHFGDFTRGLLGRFTFLGDIWGTFQDRFDGSKLVMVRDGSLGDRYDRLRELGKGAQGTASLLRRRRTGQEYVAKESLGEDSEALDDAMAELSKMQALRHPHCAKVVEFLSAMPKAITICEFAHHGDLANYIKKLEPSEAVIASIFKQAMSGVAFLHASGCVHNDLKPENLLVHAEHAEGRAPRVAITDYGCARFVAKDQRLRFGDPRYMSPENYGSMIEFFSSSSMTTVDQRPAGDVWSMGVTLFEVLSGGALPFLYEPCTREELDEPGIFEKIRDAVLSADGLDTSGCRGGHKGLLELLPKLLDPDEFTRPTAQHVLAQLKEQEPRPSSKRCVSMAVQQDRACQILLNCVMWRLHAQHVDELRGVFEVFNTSNSGRLSRDEFKQALQQYSTKGASGADELFDMADINGDGSLEFNEFATISFDWGSLDEETLDKHIQELLEDLSLDNSDHLVLEELAKFFGSAIKRDDLQNLVLRIDVNRRGFVCAADLRCFCQQCRAKGLPAITCNVPAG